MNATHPALRENEAMLPVYYPAALYRRLLANGIESEALLNKTGIPVAYLESGDARISYRQLVQLLENALALTGNPHLGLEFGQGLGVTTMGMVGYAAMASASVQDAVLTIMRYMKLRDPLIVAEAIEHPGALELRFSEPLDFGNVRHFMYCTIYSSFFNVMSFLSELDADDCHVTLSYAKPEDWSDSLLPFSFKLLFGQKSESIFIRREALLRPLKTADPISARSAREACEQALEINAEMYLGASSIVAEVENLLQNRLDRLPPMEVIAQQLAMSPRTLRRRLEAAGTGYRTVLEQLRHKQALHYLRNTELGVAEIAQRLGYQDPSNFGRAFRRQFGKSPSDWRRD